MPPKAVKTKGKFLPKCFLIVTLSRIERLVRLRFGGAHGGMARVAMKKIFALGGVVLLLAGCAVMGGAGAREARLFDGKSFSGWIGDTNKTFRIREDAIVGGTMK